MGTYNLGMAKPSKEDISAAEDLCQVLNAIDDRNRWGIDTIADCPSFDQLVEDDAFDPDEKEHLGALYNKLMTLMGSNPSFHNRVISGMCHVIMYEKNRFIDPAADTIQFHPRFGEMADDLERETAAARYWNKRYHEVVAERDSVQNQAAGLSTTEVATRQRLVVAPMYELGQTIHYQRDNKPHSAPVLARARVENLRQDWVCTNEQKLLYMPFGESGVFYSTCHGIINENDAFESQDDLA